jgi:hypothetical protein
VTAPLQSGATFTAQYSQMAATNLAASNNFLTVVDTGRHLTEECHESLAIRLVDKGAIVSWNAKCDNT